MNEIYNSHNQDRPNFELFEGAGSRIGAYYIGITANGTISLYTGFVRKEAMENKKSASLFYDKKNQYLGIKFYTEPVVQGGGNFSVKHSDSGKNAWIAGRNLFSFYNLDPDSLKGRYVPKLQIVEEHGKIYYIDLSKKID